MIDESSYSEAVADELELTLSAYAEDVTGEVSLTTSAYGEDVAYAINERPVGPATLRVLQYNIGHFNMGMANGEVCYIGANNDTTKAYPQFFNYATQLQRWKDRIGGIDADIISMPEYNVYFGYNGIKVSTIDTGIFSLYNHLSVGAIAADGWWQNTLASKLPMADAADIPLGSTFSWKAYVRLATVTIGGKTVKIGATHLNWRDYNSRQVELKSLVKMFKDDPYVILMGDFNTIGPSGGTAWQGLQEFDIFRDGFTENGVTYNGGFTLANSTDNPLLTSPATNSRPDSSGSQVPNSYIDNIIVKGFTMSNITVIDDGTITDHCGLYCDLTMIEEGGGQ